MWKSYNDETLRFWRENDPDVQIIVATSILSVGIDAPKFDGVVILGELDVDEYWQELGRIRPRTQDRNARGILYLTKGAEQTARETVQGGTSDRGKKVNKATIGTKYSSFKLPTLGSTFLPFPRPLGGFFGEAKPTLSLKVESWETVGWPRES